MADPRSSAARRRRRWRRRSAVAAGTVVLLGAGGYVAYAQVSKPDTDSAYRLATAGKGSVSRR